MTESHQAEGDQRLIKPWRCSCPSAAELASSYIEMRAFGCGEMTTSLQRVWSVLHGGEVAHRSFPDWERVSRPGLMGELRSQPLLRGGLRGSSLVRLKGGSCAHCTARMS